MKDPSEEEPEEDLESDGNDGNSKRGWIFFASIVSLRNFESKIWKSCISLRISERAVFKTQLNILDGTFSESS